MRGEGVRGGGRGGERRVGGRMDGRERVGIDGEQEGGREEKSGPKNMGMFTSDSSGISFLSSTE